MLANEYFVCMSIGMHKVHFVQKEKNFDHERLFCLEISEFEIEFTEFVPICLLSVRRCMLVDYCCNPVTTTTELEKWYIN